MEIKVKRANKILRIDEKSKETYLELGYDVIDAKGNIVEHNRKNVTAAEYTRLEEENKALKTEIEKLNAENKALKAKKVKSE